MRAGLTAHLRRRADDCPLLLNLRTHKIAWVKTLVGFVIIILLVGGCAAHNPAPQHIPANTISPPGITIISAVYGSGSTFADVTGRVDDLLHEPLGELFARPGWLQADPTPGWNKALIIEYAYRNQRHIFTIGEGGQVNLNLLVKAAKEKPHSSHRHRSEKS